MDVIIHYSHWETSFANVRGILRNQMNGVSVGMDMNELSHVTNEADYSWIRVIH